MMVFDTVLLFFTAAYGFFILWCLWGWLSIQNILPAKPNETPGVTVIVPVRNEASFIVRCLWSLLLQKFPHEKLEVIVVDDHSLDATPQLVEEFQKQHPGFNLKLVQLKEMNLHSKKAAIQRAVKEASFPVLLTTDGDCVVPPGWVHFFATLQANTGAKFIAGPVTLTEENDLLHRLQGLELMGLVGIAAAGIKQGKPMMCNGAGLSYTREAFEAVGGFASERPGASGDDTQLMLKIAKAFPGDVYFLKDRAVVVRAEPVDTMSDLWQQRKRWAGKIPLALTPFTIGIAVIAWFAHFLLLFAALCCIVGRGGWDFFLAAFLLKAVPEFLFLHTLSGFFRRRDLLRLFLPAQPFYWIYITVVGLIAPFSSFEWKGRRVK